MWVFLPGGLLMPAALPTLAEDKIEVDKRWTHDGKFDLQVRARVKRHLENFIGMYMSDGTYSDIQATPDMDYNFRFYTTRDDFAWAMGKAIADIDYQKFKPTAETKNDKGGLMYGPESVDYHSVLNSMWGTITKLGSPGGVWSSGWGSHVGGGSYRSIGSSYKKTGESAWGQIDHVDYGDGALPRGGAEVVRGINFGEDDEDAMMADAPPIDSPEFNEWWIKNVLPKIDDNAENPDYYPEAESVPIDPADRQWWRENLLEEANRFNVPLEDWRTYFTAAEFDLLKADYEAFLIARRRQAKKNRKQRRKARAKNLSEL